MQGLHHSLCKRLGCSQQGRSGPGTLLASRRGPGFWARLSGGGVPPPDGAVASAAAAGAAGGARWSKGLLRLLCWIPVGPGRALAGVRSQLWSAGNAPWLLARHGRASIRRCLTAPGRCCLLRWGVRAAGRAQGVHVARHAAAAGPPPQAKAGPALCRLQGGRNTQGCLLRLSTACTMYPLMYCQHPC